jgi:hypothetical protein
MQIYCLGHTIEEHRSNSQSLFDYIYSGPTVCDNNGFFIVAQKVLLQNEASDYSVQENSANDDRTNDRNNEHTKNKESWTKGSSQNLQLPVSHRMPTAVIVRLTQLHSTQLYQPSKKPPPSHSAYHHV